MKGQQEGLWFIQCDECEAFFPDIDGCRHAPRLGPLMQSARYYGWQLKDRDLCRICARTAELAEKAKAAEVAKRYSPRGESDGEVKADCS